MKKDLRSVFKKFTLLRFDSIYWNGKIMDLTFDEVKL